jgi:hypothetical protein
MEDHNQVVQEQPVYNLAAPLFLMTSIPFFAAMVYDYVDQGSFDKTFAWFGLFYLGIGGYYLARKFLNK